jgi:hypothetical protein
MKKEENSCLYSEACNACGCDPCDCGWGHFNMPRCVVQLTARIASFFDKN